MAVSTYTTDTSPEAAEAQLECLRRMTPQERISQMCALSRQVKQMAFDAIRRRHPEFSEAEVQLRFIEMTYGEELAEQVRLFRSQRNL